jgi:E3 ubiquitin-protein ligase DOA10
MKQSESVNSLTELTVSQEQNTCFICLEEAFLDSPLVDSKLLRNCGCHFYVHPNCWNVWMKNKTDFDCPICHKASMLKIHIPPNPILAYREEARSPTRVRILLSSICVLFLIGAGIMIDRIINS